MDLSSSLLILPVLLVSFLSMPSALFDKCRAALRTADLDFSLAFRDTDLLPATRTLIDMIYLHETY